MASEFDDTHPSDLFATISPTSHPLVASYSIGLVKGAKIVVQFGLTEAYGRSTNPVPAPPGGGSVSVLIAGMRASTTYHVRGRIQLPDGKWLTTPDQTFTTGAIPNIAVPTLTATTSANQTPNPGVELVNVIDPNGISVVSDLDGNILWYYDNVSDASWKGYAFPIKPMRNGHLMAAITNLYSAGVPQSIPYNSVLREIDLVGDSIKELYLADLNTALKAMGSDVQALCYSHDVLPLWNGHTILIVQQQKTVQLTAPPGPGQFTILGDALVDLDENFRPVWTWSAFDWLDVNRHPMEFTAASGYDWTHCNGVQLAPDGNLVLSSRHQNWLMKLDYKNGSGSGAIIWKLGYQGDFTLVGSSAATDWFFAQHFPNLLTASGDQITSLSVFDNGNDRCYATPAGCPQSGLSSPPPFSRGVIFKIDESAKAAQLAWQYPLNQYSYWGGNVMALVNGDIEICASEPVAIGTTPPSTDVPSQVVELKSGGEGPPEIVWQMKVSPGGTYRSYRIGSLYPGVVWPE